MTAATTSPVLETLARHRVIPVVVLDDAAAAPGLAAALVAGGLPVAEVTLRTTTACATIRSMAADGRLLVGAGTVVHAAQVDAAAAAGARFVVSPGFSAPVVRRALEVGLPVVPGVATPSEILAALTAGLDTVKLFPAATLGGPPALAALAAPFPGLRFIPTGGITEASMGSYLAHPAVAAVGGSWMVAPALLRARDFDTIRHLTAQAVQAAAPHHDGSEP